MAADDVTGLLVDRVRVVTVDEVEAVRRSAPKAAIVALVSADQPMDAVRARMAGADVVVPSASDGSVHPEVLAAAGSAASLLAHRTALHREVASRTAHGMAGNASAVSMAAELLARDDAQRARQLRDLAALGAELAWDAGRPGRSTHLSMELLEVPAVVRWLCRPGRRAGVAPDLTVGENGAGLVLADRIGLVRTFDALLDLLLGDGSHTLAVRVEEDGEAVAIVVSGEGAPAADDLRLREAAEFAADHAGSLQLASEGPNQGSVAVLRLPTVPAASPRPLNDIGSSSRTDADWSISRILEGIARRDQLEASLEGLVEVMEQRLPESICSILLYEEQTATLKHGAGRRLPPPYRAAIDGVHVGPRAGSCGTAAFSRVEVVATDIATDPRWVDYRGVALAHGLGSCWSTPILDVERGVVLGTFAVYHATSWSPDASAAELILRLTHVAGVAIGTASLHGRLVESEARFRSMFETTGVGITLVGADGRIQQANAALVQMAGPVAGRQLVDLLHEEDAQTVRTALAAALDRAQCGGSTGDERLPPLEVRIRADHGAEPTWVALSGSLISGRGRGQHTHPGYFSIELFDLTERRRVAQAHRERAVAEAANRAKSDLLALVSHELRTPLNAVIGFAQLLDKRDLSADQQRDGIEHILSAGRHLLRLINDLIDLTGAELGQLRPRLEPVALGEVCEEVSTMLMALAQERDVTVRHGLGVPDCWVRADRQRLRQVLVNLVGNGIKFTSAGGCVSLAVAHGAVTVADTGPGIAPEHLEHLFTPFHRVGDSSAEGSGLGLALSQRLTVAMGGRLSVRSEVGVGTRLRVELPVCDPHGDVAPDSEPPVADHPLCGRVIYVEDDLASQRLLVSALSRWPEVEVEVADTCAHALALLAGDRPDVIVADVELPDGNGWQLLRTLSEAGTAPAHAIVVTAGSAVPPQDMSDIEVLGKPLVLNQLIDSIGRRLSPGVRR